MSITATAEPVIAVTGLTKAFNGRRVVDDFDINVPKGAIYGFLGPNGSGKTTTIRMLCGLLTPDAGEGTCLGFDILREANRIKAEAGYMTQKFSLYEDLSIRENLDFVARMYRMPQRRRRVDAALEDLGLADRAKQLAGTLSGGWKQRLALAACLIHDPKLLLLDEPTAGVDPKARRDFWDEIRRLAKAGVTVLVSTHYMDEAVQCDFITYIAYGRKLIDGPSTKIPEMVGLVTWRAEGPELAALEEKLKGLPGVGQVARFGAVLHVSGTDEAALGESVARLEAEGPQRWSKQPAGLEEAFIYLMAGARDNFARDTPEAAA
jgi:ABC-2 type transport system ATP-binding protein